MPPTQVLDATRCQHKGCFNKSRTGWWCQSCIEFEWPQIRVDDRHWLAWKGVKNLSNSENLAIGAMGAPYQIGKVTRVLGFGNWLCSPLGAIKEGYGSHLMAAVIDTGDAQLGPNLVLDSRSACLPLKLWPKAELISKKQAKDLLDSVEENWGEIASQEKALREEVVVPADIELPPPLVCSDVGRFEPTVEEMIRQYLAWMLEGFDNRQQFTKIAAEYNLSIWEQIARASKRRVETDPQRIRRQLLRLAWEYLGDWDPRQSPYGL